MARGRYYYDPIVQTPSSIDPQETKERIEVFPVGMDSTSRLPVEVGKWASRRVNEEGSIVEQGPSASQQHEAISMAQEKWPGLSVYMLTMEMEDSSWDGMGPSPRLWQQERAETEVAMHGYERPGDVPPAVEAAQVVPLSIAEPQPPQIHAVSVKQPGVYINLDDILLVLEDYAAQFDQENNPSAALGLREAAKALREAF